MSNYGVLIDSGVDLEKTNIYSFFVQYFDNPRLTEIKKIQAGMYTVFGCRVRSLLAREQRYILVTVPDAQVPRGNPTPYLESLEWACLETRTLSDDLKINTHTYTRKADKTLINIFSKNEGAYVYSCPEFPSLSVSLFFLKNQTRPYNDKGTLGLALETYQCAVNV